MNSKNIPVRSEFKLFGSMIDVLSEVRPEMMKQAHEEDVDISTVVPYAKADWKPNAAQIHKIR